MTVALSPATGTAERVCNNNDDLKIGRIEKVVQTGENAPETKLETPLDALIEAVLMSEEHGSVQEGTDIKIVLTVDDAADIVSVEDKTAVETVLGSSDNYKLGQYLDVNLLKIIGGEQEKITETSAPITITFSALFIVTKRRRK